MFRFPKTPHWFLWLAAIDLALVAVFVAMRLLQGLDVIPKMPQIWDIMHDEGMAERFNHLKWAAIVMLLLATWHRLRVPALLAMAIMFTVVMADDALRLHERMGETLAARWPTPVFGLTPSGTGELATWALMGLITLPALIWGLVRTPQAWRARLWPPVLGFAGVLVFAVGVDMAQQPLWHLENKALFYWSKTAFGIVEDTGEAVFASLTLAYTAMIWHAHARTTAPLHAPAE